MDTTLTQSTVAPLVSGLTLCDDGLVRPTWASHDELLRSYYDTEWGLPVHDEAGVFERWRVSRLVSHGARSWQNARRSVRPSKDSFPIASPPSLSRMSIAS